MTNNFKVSESITRDILFSNPLDRSQAVVYPLPESRKNINGSGPRSSFDRKESQEPNSRDDMNENNSALHAALLLTSLASKSEHYEHRDMLDKSGNFVQLGGDKNLRIRSVSIDGSGLPCSPYESLRDYINDHPTAMNYRNLIHDKRTKAISPPDSPPPLGAKQRNEVKKSPQVYKRERSKSMLDPRKRFCLRKQEQCQQNKQLSSAKERKYSKENYQHCVQDAVHLEATIKITSNSHKRPLQPFPKAQLASQTNTTILRRKFSWKNYPELEAFLIANREEYLRHSALNYTAQQKQYNNRLTERLLELASKHGYIFDEQAFSFVTVRDRIRCYYKSYVQSSKKRGLIIGYAARKAGLLTEDDLEKSAGIEGRIIVPEL